MEKKHHVITQHINYLSNLFFYSIVPVVLFYTVKLSSAVRLQCTLSYKNVKNFIIYK